jgi:hypothetical protein
MSTLKATSWQTLAGVQGPLLASNGVIITKLPVVSRVHNTNVSTTGAAVVAGFGNTVIDTIGSSTFGSYGIRPQRSGNYLIVADLQAGGTGTSGFTPLIRLLKNGSLIHSIAGIVNYASGHSHSLALNRVVTANGSSDYFEIGYSHNSGNNMTVASGGFAMFRIGDL